MLFVDDYISLNLLKFVSGVCFGTSIILGEYSLGKWILTCLIFWLEQLLGWVLTLCVLPQLVWLIQSWKIFQIVLVSISVLPITINGFGTREHMHEYMHEYVHEYMHEYMHEYVHEYMHEYVHEYDLNLFKQLKFISFWKGCTSILLKKEQTHIALWSKMMI